MRKIYLVKKNPELPANGNNWIVMPNDFPIVTVSAQKKVGKVGYMLLKTLSQSTRLSTAKQHVMRSSSPEYL